MDEGQIRQPVPEPVTLETLGSVALSSSDFFCEVGRRLSAATGDVREMAYWFQRLSVTVLRYNFVLIQPHATAVAAMRKAVCFNP